jgi:hypothetical protein
MRRVFLAVLMAGLALSVFAQSYTVQSVAGRVEREEGAQRVAVKAGDALGSDAVVHTGIGASLVLREGERTLSVPAARSGRVAELATVSAGVRIGGNIAHTDTGAVARTTAQVSTASARASEMAMDGDIAEE